MKQIIYIITILLLNITFIHADECDDWYNDANNAFNHGEYQKAKHYYEQCKKNNCPYSVNDKIKQCNEKLNPPKPKTSTSSSSSTSTSTHDTNFPSAEIIEVKQEPNYYQNGKKGIRILTTFIVRNLLNKEGYIVAWFADENYKNLKYYGESNYINSSNSIMVYDTFTPKLYNDAQYNDYDLFIPYSELHHTGTIKFYVDIRQASTEEILTTSNWNSFTYSPTPTTTTTPTTTPTTTYQPATLALSKTSIYAPSSGTTAYITVSSNRNWKIKYPSGSYYDTYKNGNTITVTLKPNTEYKKQEDFFYVQTDDETKEIKVMMYIDPKVYSSSYSSSSSSSSSSYSSYSSSYYGDRTIDKWYSNAGRVECSWWSMKFFAGTNFGADISMFDLRLWCFGLEPAVFGAKLSYNLTYQFYYCPKIKVYIPMSKRWSFTMAAGPSISLRKTENRYTYHGYSDPITSIDYWFANQNYKNFWFNAELAFRCNHTYSCVNTDIFLRYNEGFALGVAWTFTSAWRTSY